MRDMGRDVHKGLPVDNQLVMRQKQQHVGEGYALAGFVRDASLVVQAIVQVLPPLDSSTVDAAEDPVHLVEIIAADELLVP